MLIHEIHYGVNRHFTDRNYVYKFILIRPNCDAVCVDKWVTTYSDILYAPSSTSTMLSVMDRDFVRQTAITKSKYLMSTNTKDYVVDLGPSRSRPGLDNMLHFRSVITI